MLRTSLALQSAAVVADRRRLKQILLNLLTNAIKFTKDGGQVIVSARLVDGGISALRVHDNGIGMTATKSPLAMQPFHQLDTAPRKQTGTGLGLPVTKALADANRARLALSSEPWHRHLGRCDLPGRAPVHLRLSRSGQLAAHHDICFVRLRNLWHGTDLCNKFCHLCCCGSIAARYTWLDGFQYLTTRA